MTIDPVTLLLAGGSAYKALSGRRMALYEAEVARQNKKIAEENANRAIYRSQVEAQESDAVTAGMLGEQVAAQGASGLAITGRSFTNARRAGRELGRLDALRIIQGGELEAHNFRVDAMNFGAQEGMARDEAKNALLEGFLDVGSSLVSGAGKTQNPNRFSLLRRKPRGGSASDYARANRGY